MDRATVKNIIEGLGSQSSSKVIETILRIRVNIIINDNGIKLFRECNGLDGLILLLKRSNKRVVDLALSVLGNLCLQEDCCLLVGKYPLVATTLVSILNNYTQDSIIGRTCKLLGNLAQKTSNLDDIYNAGAVSAITKIIINRNKKTSHATLSLAVRALRLLWMCYDKRDDMLNQETARTVATLMCVECDTLGIIKKGHASDVESLDIHQSQEELFQSILKCIGCFTVSNSPECAQQIQGDGRGYQSLVALSKLYEKTALQCLLNLCFVPSCRPHLGVAGFVERLVDILQKVSEVTEWPEGCCRALANLNSEAVNRARLKTCGGIPLMLRGAKQNTYLLRSLLNYVFDDTAFEILISEGLVTFLAEELQQHVSSMKCAHVFPNKSSSDDKSTTSTEKESSSDSNNLERDSCCASDSDNDDELFAPIACKRSRASHPYKWTDPNRKWSMSWLEQSADWPSPKASKPNVAQSPDWESGWASSWSPSSDSECASPQSKRMRWDWSPDSGVSSMPSPKSSYSPFQSSTNDNDSSDSSDRYSPICSEGEEDDEVSVGTKPIEVEGDKTAAASQMQADSTAADNVSRHLNALFVSDGINDEDEKDTVLPSEHSLCRASCILTLARRIWQKGQKEREQAILLVDSSTEKGGAPLIAALLDYLCLCERPLGRPAHILRSIFSNLLCLTWLLKNRFATKLKRMVDITKHPTADCKQCMQVTIVCSRLLIQMSSMAESEFGVGEICHMLSKGSDVLKQILVVSLPHIVRSERILKKFYITHDGLNILLSFLEESKDNIEDCVSAISRLALNARVKNPKSLERKFSDQIQIEYDPILEDLAPDRIVTFQLDDCSIVRADKIFLCQNSDVFNAMLKGSFKEAGQENVILRKVSKHALEYMLTLLQNGFNNCLKEYGAFPLAQEVDTNLEVLLLADRFLFDKMKEHLESAIQQFVFSPESAEKIYIWALSDGMGYLCVESLAFLLTSDMREKDRVNAFKNIMNLEYKVQCADDIKSMISRHLSKHWY